MSSIAVYRMAEILKLTWTFYMKSTCAYTHIPIFNLNHFDFLVYTEDSELPSGNQFPL
jgi:hypothetical protein